MQRSGGPSTTVHRPDDLHVGSCWQKLSSGTQRPLARIQRPRRLQSSERSQSSTLSALQFGGAPAQSPCDSQILKSAQATTERSRVAHQINTTTSANTIVVALR